MIQAMLALLLLQATTVQLQHADGLLLVPWKFNVLYDVGGGSLEVVVSLVGWLGVKCLDRLGGLQTFSQHCIWTAWKQFYSQHRFEKGKSYACNVDWGAGVQTGFIQALATSLLQLRQYKACRIDIEFLELMRAHVSSSQSSARPLLMDDFKWPQNGAFAFSVWPLLPFPLPVRSNPASTNSAKAAFGGALSGGGRVWV